MFAWNHHFANLVFLPVRRSWRCGYPGRVNNSSSDIMVHLFDLNIYGDTYSVEAVGANESEAREYLAKASQFGTYAGEVAVKEAPVPVPDSAPRAFLLGLRLGYTLRRILPFG